MEDIKAVASLVDAIHSAMIAGADQSRYDDCLAETTRRRDAMIERAVSEGVDRDAAETAVAIATVKTAVSVARMIAG